MSDETLQAHIDKQASEWFVQLRSPELAAGERECFAAWLAADPRHARAYEQTTQTWEALEALHAWKVTEPVPELSGGVVARCLQFANGWAYRPVALACAGALVLCAAVGLVALFASGPGPASAQATQTAEIREVNLPDGSVVTLGARSAIDIRYSPGERRVVLAQGEAFFAVRKNPARPFVVIANDTRVRVLGTQFNVHCDLHRTRVAVKEGLVEVTPAPGASSAADHPDHPDHPDRPGEKYVLAAGQKVIAEQGRAYGTVDAIRPDAVGAWRSGRLVYENVTLDEVVADAGRYFDGAIEFSDPALKALRVTAAFQTDEIEHLFDTLTLVLPLQVEHPGPGLILLRPHQK